MNPVAIAHLAVLLGRAAPRLAPIVPAEDARLIFKRQATYDHAYQYECASGKGGSASTLRLRVTAERIAAEIAPILVERYPLLKLYIGYDANGHPLMQLQGFAGGNFAVDGSAPRKELRRDVAARRKAAFAQSLNEKSAARIAAKIAR